MDLTPPETGTSRCLPLDLGVTLDGDVSVIGRPETVVSVTTVTSSIGNDGTTVRVLPLGSPQTLRIDSYFYSF